MLENLAIRHAQAKIGGADGINAEHSPAESGFGWYRAARMRRTTSLLMGIPKARVICCAIRGHPHVGFRCFMSTTAAMTSWLGPFGPGFFFTFDENSRRY